MGFITYLKEDSLVHDKLIHLQHAEDLPLVAGDKGFHQAFGALKAVGENLEGKYNPTKTTIKYDGSPSVVFGHHGGKFFVASKSAFNKTPKLNYTPEDIQKNHGHAPGLVEKLQSALEHLKKVAPKHGIYQGDLMYTDQDKHESKDHINFTPNTIMYSLPKKSEEGRKAAAAKLGIAVHTQYHGSDITKMKAAPLDNHSKFKEHKDVHILPHEVNMGDALREGKHITAFEHNMKMAEKVHNEMGPSLNHVMAHSEHVLPYINKTVKDNSVPSVAGYRLHLLQQGQKDVEGVKTAAAKQRHHDAMQTRLHHVEEHSDHFRNFFRLHRHLQLAKNALVHQLNTSTHEMEHSIGGKPTAGEGFVVHHQGYPVKFVNRAEFSAANFAAHGKK